MLSTSRKWARTSRGRVVYDRKLHPFSDRDVERITQRFVDDNQGFMEDVVLPFMVRITRWMLERILALVGAEAAAGVILEWMLEITNKVMSWLFSWWPGKANQAAFRVFQWGVEPFMTPEQLVGLRRYLRQYETETAV